LNINAEECLSRELRRIHEPEVVEKCRRRHQEKTASGVVGKDNQEVRKPDDPFSLRQAQLVSR
jgi:hypothetical protein